MRQTKRRYWFTFISIWPLFFPAESIGQSIYSHKTYFKAALTAKTPDQAANYTQQACVQAIGRHQFRVAYTYRFLMSAAFYQQSHYQHGITQARQGLALAQRYSLPDDGLTFKYYSLLASMYSRLTMTDSASYWYYQAEQLLRVKPRLLRLIPDHIEAYYYNKGLFFMRLGDQNRAVIYINKSVEMARQTGDRRSIALSYLQLANYYFSVHQYEKAATQYQQALRGFSHNSVDACWGKALLGNCFQATNRVKEGLRLLQISQRSYARLVSHNPSLKDYDFEFESSYYRGKCEQRSGLVEAASRSYQTSIGVYRRLHGDRGELIAASWVGLAGVAFEKKQFDQALALVQQAIRGATVLFSAANPGVNPAPDDIKAGKVLYEALHLKGQIWFKRYQYESNPQLLIQAIDAYRVGLQVAQRIRRSFTRLESTYFFNEKIHPCVEHTLEALVESQSQPSSPQQYAVIFEVLQAYQAMGMADVLHEKQAKHETIPIKTLQLEQDLRQQLALAETQLLNHSTPADRSIINRISNLKRQFYFFEEVLAHKFPRYYSLKYANEQLSLTDLQRRLTPETAYLSYFVGERFVYGFFATKSRIVVFRRVMTPVFTQALPLLRQALTQNPGMFEYEGRPTANQLYDYLIGPVESRLPSIRRLIIERDGLLNAIPFEVLEPAGQPETYLCKRVAISYSYSAKLTFHTTKLDGLLRPACYAPYSEDSSWRGKNHEALHLLPQSAVEARQVGGSLYVNSQATKAQFLRTSKQATLLHLATHATANDVRPEHSSISFYPNTPDSLLRVLEITNLPLDHTRLVILSACEGNAGVLQKAEGVLSLARAFRLAGCPTILTTTWSAHNETTSEQTHLFYNHLYRGLPADEALQQARLDFFASPSFRKWGHPYYWANFTLIGNPDVSFTTQDSSAKLLLVVAICLSISIIAIFLFRHLRL